VTWVGVTQAPHSMDNARDMMPPPDWSLPLDSLPDSPPVKSSGPSTARLSVQALPERR